MPASKIRSPATAASTSTTASHHDDAAIDQQYNSAWINARRNFSYFYNPTSSERPVRFRTRALLRTVRYVTQFILWRLVRWAKYAAVASLVAAVSASAVGGFVSGVGWLAAPPTMGASVIALLVWQGGKFAAAKLHKRWRATGMDQGELSRERQTDHSTVATGSMRLDAGPNAIPW